MPIPLPNLDDRSFDDLVAEARALIPALCPQWTNHNRSDPGMVLVELLAWLTEMLIYRLNEIPEQNLISFLELLNGSAWQQPHEQGGLPQRAALEQAIRVTVLELRRRYRAVTSADFEYLSLHEWPPNQSAAEANAPNRIQRVRCVPRRNLDASDPVAQTQPAEGHVSLVIVPPMASSTPTPTPELCRQLREFLDQRRLLGLRLHVVGPRYVTVRVSAELVLHDDALPQAALQQAQHLLAAHFHPLSGGDAKTGWPFGRNVYLSEIFALLEGLDLVNYVDSADLVVPGAAQRHRMARGQPVGIDLDAHELVVIDASGLVARDIYGDRYRLEQGKVLKLASRST